VLQSAYNLYYTDYSKYTDNRTATGGGGFPGDHERLQATAERLRLAFDNVFARIVDIGCANGGLLAALQERGYKNLCGIDPSPVCANFTHEKYGIQTYANALDKLPPTIGTFDGVILSHVLEHVLDLHEALRCTRAILNPNGTLYLQVPDATRYRDFVFSPFQDFNTEHINHFSHPSLTNLGSVAQFEVKMRGELLLESSPGMPYPAIDQFWRLANSRQGTLVRDTELRTNTEDYIVKSKQLLFKMEKQIRKAVEAEEPLLIWGTGQLAMKLLAETSLRNAKIAGFVDSNPVNHGKTIFGHPILSPQEVRGLSHPILIASTLHVRSISSQIANELGMPNRIIVLETVGRSGS